MQNNFQASFPFYVARLNIGDNGKTTQTVIVSNNTQVTYYPKIIESSQLVFFKKIKRAGQWMDIH